MLKCSVMVFVLVLFLGGCKNPEQAYFKEISKLGFIPFRAPVTAIGTGTVLRGSPAAVTAIAPPSRCFPDEWNGKPTQLRWVSGVSIPNTYRNIKLSFNGNLNSVVGAGTPGLQFNLAMNKVQNVELDISEAQIEMIDQLALQEFYRNGMSSECKNLLLSFPFIMEALQVTKMSFSFYDAFGGKMQLTSENIGDFALMGADLQWYIEQGSKLVIISPKFIGYRLAQLRPADDGFAKMTSSATKRNEYVWQDNFKKEEFYQTVGLEVFAPKRVNVN